MSNGSGGGVFGMPGIALPDLATSYRDADATAFAPPHDAAKDGTRATAKLVYRDLPIVTIQNTWSIDQARSALYSHVIGRFDTSTQLWEAVIADPRVTATLGSRVSGLFGRPLQFKAANDSDAAAEVLAAWEPACRKLLADAATVEIHTTTIGLGLGPAQVVWDTSDDACWKPSLRPWHLRFSYYDWTLRRVIAITQDGPVAITPGDGKWLMHAPFGDYRGWLRGVIRSVSEPYMLRHFGFRDMARFGEIHGLPTRVGKVPAVSEPEERAAFETALQNLGADAAIIIPQGVDAMNGGGYDYGLVESNGRGWEVHPGQIDRCDMDIILAIMFQNLTTEVQGGSYGATKSHMDIRQSGLQFDDTAWSNTIYRDIARPFAWLNFGDPDLAPHTCRDVEPRADLEGNAKQFQQFGTAIEVLARGGVKFKDVEALRKFASEKFGLHGLPDFTIGDPVAGGLGGGKDIAFTPTDLATFITVDEARSQNGLAPLPEDGELTIAEFKAKHGDVIAAGTEATDPPAPAPKPAQEEEGDDE